MFCFSSIGNANNFETMEECILNCSGPDNQGEDESKEEIFISPLDSFSSRLHRLKTSFNNRNRGSLKTESPIQGRGHPHITSPPFWQFLTPPPPLSPFLLHRVIY